MIKLSEQQKKHLADGFAALALRTPEDAQRSSDYPAPAVPEASSGVLAPLNALPGGIHVTVAYEPMSPSDVIGLSFNGDDTFVPQYGNASGTVIFSVAPSHVAKSLGKKIPVGYVVSRQDGGESELLMLDVLPLMEGDMKMVKITQATESMPGALDLSTFAGDAEVVIDPWPFITEGQPVWLDMISDSSTQHILKAYPVTSIEVTEGINRPISRSLLEILPDGSLLEFAAKVQLDGSGSETGAQPFLPLKLTLQHSGGEGYTEDFEGYSSGQKPAIFNTRYMTFTARLQSLIQQSDARKMIYQAEFVGATDKLDIVLISTYSKVVIDAYCNPGNHATLICEYEDGVQEVRVEGPYWSEYTFTHHGIKGFKIRGTYPSCALKLDNFRFSK